MISPTNILSIKGWEKLWHEQGEETLWRFCLLGGKMEMGTLTC